MLLTHKVRRNFNSFLAIAMGFVAASGKSSSGQCYKHIRKREASPWNCAKHHQRWARDEEISLKFSRQM